MSKEKEQNLDASTQTEPEKQVQKTDREALKLKKENDALKAEVSSLKEELVSLKKDLEMKKTEALTTVVLNGLEQEVVCIELAKEVSEMVRKRYLDEDQTCVVLKRHGY